MNKPAKQPAVSPYSPHQVSAGICLYGTSALGFGYLADTRIDGQLRIFGDSTPTAGRGATEAMWLAAQELLDAGVRGHVAVHIDVGDVPMVAVFKLGDLPAFGGLVWRRGSTVQA